MKASEIRQTFLKFFESKGHTIVASSPVVPGDDPTLLFTNAGMNQFKDVFLGFDKRPYNRATDLAEVHPRRRQAQRPRERRLHRAPPHLLRDAGQLQLRRLLQEGRDRYAWELLTEVYKLPKDKLWVTVYAEDDEAYEIWNKEIGVPAERIVRIGDNKGARYASDNFWMMGDTGPCGPCTEIFYDHGPEIAGGPPGSPDEDGDRYIEIWNNVFMQFNRDEAGVMHKLPKPSVDTGMGLERLTAVLQHVHSNYEIDLFVTLLAAAKKVVDAAGAGDCDAGSPSLKVIADHIRACSFTVVDGVIPGNEGRGYVLRRITRRAIRHGYKLGARKPFFHALVAALVAEMGDAYPELRQGEKRVTEVLKQEEEGFFRTIANGMEILEAALAERGGRGAGDRRRRCVQAARHLRLPARPDRRRLPRARRRGRQRRLRRGDEPPARTSARGRQVQDGAGPRVQRRRDDLPRLRGAGARRRARRRDLRRRHFGSRGPLRRRRGDRARPHAVLCRVAAARSATPASCATPRSRACSSTTRSRSRPRCSATTAASSKARSRSAMC